MIEDLGRVHRNILDNRKVERGIRKSPGRTPFRFCNTAFMDFAPRRVVSLQPSATVILRDLGKLDLLVACTKYCAEVCPEVRNAGVQIVADSWTAHSEQIRSAHPDLVIAAVPYQEQALAEIMKSGARFLGLAPRTLADIYGDIATISGIFHAQEQGLAVIERMQKEIEAVRSKTRHLPRPRVFCEEWGKPLIASQGWVAELIEAAGGEFIGIPGAQIGFNEVNQTKPEVLIASWCGAGDRVPLEKLISTRGWEQTPAARNGLVCCIRDEYLNTPAPTLIQGLHALSAAIHPQCFPQAKGLRWINAE